MLSIDRATIKPGVVGDDSRMGAPVCHAVELQLNRLLLEARLEKRLASWLPIHCVISGIKESVRQHIYHGIEVSKMGNELLDEFACRLIGEVRDATISNWQMILSGHLKGERADRLRLMTNDIQPEVVLKVVEEAVDSTLHHLLQWLEEENDFKIRAVLGDCQCDDLAEESDGFSGELYTQEGWIARFSQHG